MYLSNLKFVNCLGGAAVRRRTRDRNVAGFDFRPGRYQVNYVNSAFHPSEVGKSSTSLSGWD